MAIAQEAEFDKAGYARCCSREYSERGDPNTHNYCGHDGSVLPKALTSNVHPHQRPPSSLSLAVVASTSSCPSPSSTSASIVGSSRLRLRLALASSFVAAFIHITQQRATAASKTTTTSTTLASEKNINANMGGRAACTVPIGGRGVLMRPHESGPRRRRNSHASGSTPMKVATRPMSVHAQPRRTGPGSRLFSNAAAGTSTRTETPTTSAEAGTPHKKEDLNVPKSAVEPLDEVTDINKLMWHPDLLKDIKKPRHPIVLCHGLYGFDVRGPFLGLEIHYWASVLDVLRKRVGAEVIVRGVPGTGAIADRALALHKFLKSPDAGVRGKKINFIGHSMGGLDARHVISVLKPDPQEEYEPVSLTTVATPHRGSPFMDWCNANVGTGNERVETEIKEARERLKEQGTSAHEEGMQDKSGPAKIPYSLKTPLFVRPKQEKQEAKVVSQQQQKEENGSSNAKKQGEEPAIKAATEDQGKLSEIKGAVDNAGEKLAASVVAAATTPGDALSEVRDSVASISIPSKEDIKKKSKAEGVSMLDFTAFTKALSSIGGSFSAYMLSVLDQPAYAMLSTRYMAQAFNPSVPNSPKVAYYSVAARTRRISIWHPLWLPKLVLDAAAESWSAGGERDGSGDALGKETQGNDGLVSVESAKWGQFMGVVDGCDHWDLRGGGAPRWRGRINPATGKAWAKDAATKEEEVKEEKKVKEKEQSWIDINKILGRLVGDKKKKEKKAGDEESKVEPQAMTKEGEKSGSQDTKAKDEGGQEKSAVSGDKSEVSSFVAATAKGGFVDEVAGWISDRLPQRDESRRAEAERVADEQDRKVLQMERQHQKHGEPASARDIDPQHDSSQQGISPPESSQQKTSEPKSSEQEHMPQKQGHQQLRADVEGNTRDVGQSGSASTAAISDQSPLQAARVQTKLRREAAWEEELGHVQKARDLRRELAWHRAEWDRARKASDSDSADKASEGADSKRSSSSPPPRELDWDAHAKQRQSPAELEKARTDGQKVQANELERFWIAICRHLWARGF